MASLYERPGYRTLLGRIKGNVRLYIRKQLELPKQEIAEIVRANLRALVWFGVAFAFVFGLGMAPDDQIQGQTPSVLPRAP